MPFSCHEIDSPQIRLQSQALTSASKSETTTITETEKLDLFDIRREKAFEMVLQSLGRKKRMDDGVSGLDQIMPSSSFQEENAHGSSPRVSLLTQRSGDLHQQWHELSKKKVIE
jgi:hypothetical protein